MRKLKLLSLLMLICFSVGNVWAGQVTISPAQALNEGGVSPITVACAKGDGSSNPAISSGQLRLYQAASGKTTGNTITFSSESAITSIVFTFANSMTASNGSFSEGSYDSGSSTWTGSSTSLTLTVTGTTSGTRIYITNMVVTYADGGKTLSSIAVSGTPTKTAYYAGDEFDPAGLTVTGTYSDESTAPITSGITWSYDPSQELALNQTSIDVIATVSEIASPKFNVTGLTVTEAPAAVNYEKVAAEPADWSGEYLLVYEADATNARVWKGADQANNYAEATISAGVIAAPEGAAVLTIAKVAESDPVVYTIMVGDKYIGQTSDANGIKIQTTAINNSIAYNGTDAAIDIVASSAHLRYNSASSSYFRYYKSATYSSQKKIQLYKKVDGTVKPAAGLAFETSAYLVKANGSLATPTLSTADGFDGTVTYASSNADVVAVNTTTGALTIKAAGKAEITASSLETENFKAGSAKYTVYVAEQAGTAEDPLTEASAKALIDLGCTLNAHVNGIVLSQNSTNFTVTLTDGFQFYKAKDFNNVAFESAYLGAGDEVTAVGALKKYNSTYELDEGCYLTFYEQASTPLTSIANDEASAYTVAQALEFAANPTTYDLSDVVYVRGKVAIASTALFSNKYLTYSISDDGTTTSVLKVYNGLGIDGAAFTSKDDILVGDVVVIKGNLTQYNTELEFAANNELVSKKPVATIAIDNMELEYAEVATISATITPAAAASTVKYSIKAGSDDVITLSGDQITAKSVTGTATIVATIAGTDDYEGATKEFTVSVAEADTRKVANSPAEFTTTSGDLDPADIAFEAFKGGAGNDPIVYSSTKGIRLYQISGSNTFGGFITLSAVLGCKIDQVQITTTNSYATTVAYSVDGNENLLGSESVAKSSTYTTPAGLNVESVNIVNKGTGSSGRLEIASIKVWYTGEAATVDHYELGGTYATEFEVDGEFNHAGLIVYAAFDALGENKVDITSACTFSTPDMSSEGEQTIEITYKETVVKSYNITISSTDTRKIANSPAEFEAVSGNMSPVDITYAANKGGAGNDPYLAATGIRLYQISGSNDFGGFITLKAKKGCTIDQVKITTSAEYATTVAYSVDGNENLLGSESVAKSSSYSTPAGLNVESVNILNLGTGSSGRLEIASIKVYYNGDALAVDHYILGGTYETTFGQYGEFNYEGLTVTAAYDAGETITEAVTGFTVEADLSTAGNKKAEVMLNSVKIAEYDITVTPSAKENPALAYSPASVVLTLGDALSAPTFSNDYKVSPISYESSKPAVATVDAEGNIALAGGTGTTVITASFAGDDDYIASEATFTITVNEPVEDLTGTWVLATSVAAGDKIIIGATYQDATKSMGAQNGNNRLAVASTLDAGVLSPGEGTKVFTLVDAGDGKFAIQALNGNYLSAAGTGTSNYLKEAADYTADNAKWSISIDGEGVASVVALSNNRNAMQYNSGSTLFSCYASVTSQRPINIYKKGAAPEPVYTEVRSGLEAGRHYTVCLEKNITAVKGATFWSLTYRNADGTEAYLVKEDVIEAGKPYIFQATDDNEGKLEVVYGAESVDDPVANGALRGTFDGLSASDLNAINVEPVKVYMLFNNELRPIGTNNHLDAHRAYVLYNELQPVPAQGLAPGKTVKRMPMQKDVTTDIDALNASETPVKMMIDGQLFILRGEKLYDATGRLVK